MKRILTIIATITLTCFGSTLVLAATPTTKQEAVEIANKEMRDIIGYKYFVDKNKTGKFLDWAKTKRLFNVAYGGLTGIGSLIYGEPHGDVKNEVNRYLGYTYNGEDYTNPDFPHDAWAGGFLEDRNWQKEPWDNVKGQDVNEFDGNSRYLRNIQVGIALYYADISKGGNSVMWDRWHNFIHILVPPTYYTWGMGRMWHRSDGSLWYISVPLAPGILCELPDFSTILETNKFTGVEPGQKITSTVAYRLNPDHNRAEEAKLRLHHVVGDYEYPINMTPLNGAPDPNGIVIIKPGQEFTYQYTFTVQSINSKIVARINPSNSVFPDKNWSNNRAEATVTPQAVDIKVSINLDNPSGEYWSDGSNALSYEVVVEHKDNIAIDLPVNLSIFDRNGKTVKGFTLSPKKKQWNIWMFWENVKPGIYAIEAQAWPVEGLDIDQTDNVAKKTINVRNSSVDLDSKIKTGTGDVSW